MDQVAGTTWQKTGEVEHAGVRVRPNGCAAFRVETSVKRA